LQCPSPTPPRSRRVLHASFAKNPMMVSVPCATARSRSVTSIPAAGWCVVPGFVWPSYNAPRAHGMKMCYHHSSLFCYLSTRLHARRCANPSLAESTPTRHIVRSALDGPPSPQVGGIKTPDAVAGRAMTAQEVFSRHSGAMRSIEPGINNRSSVLIPRPKKRRHRCLRFLLCAKPEAQPSRPAAWASRV
jgi:hypothetical protein